MSASITRGVLFVHSAPSALCPHVEWAASNALGVDVHFDWTPQEAVPGMLRAEVGWIGEVGTGARLASALRGWEHLRYEVTQDPVGNHDGGRWAHTPALGIFHAQTDSIGNMQVPEERIRGAMERAETYQELVDGLHLALGQAWDDELEPLRYAGAGAPVRVLHRVG